MPDYKYTTRPAKRLDGWPTRNVVEYWSPAEKAIVDAMRVVEETGGSIALTDAINLLSQAKDRVADHMEGIGTLIRKFEIKNELLHPVLQIFCQRPELIPSRSHHDDSGLDLRLNLLDETGELEILTTNPPKYYLCKENGVVLLPTGTYVAFPKKFDLQVRPRSGLAIQGMTIVNSPGTVDAGFRGEIKIIACNLNDPILLEHGQRIAQVVLAPIVFPDIVIVESKEALGESTRGEKGYGSTGV